MGDNTLLQEFAASRSEAAFAALVRHHMNLVFATANRQLGSHSLAEEVSQTVFVSLARKAGSLGRHPTVTGWLHKATLLECRRVLRTELRRQRHEQVAVALGTVSAAGDSVWASLVPLLDEALLQLNQKDRLAVLLRFLEEKALREVGQALGASEDAAQKRVARALSQMTDFFRRRGFAVPALTASAPLFAAAMQAAPAGLAASVSTVAWKAATGASGASVSAQLLLFMTQTKVQTALVATLTLSVAFTAGFYFHNRSEAKRLQAQASPSSSQPEPAADRKDRATSIVWRSFRTGPAPAALSAGQEAVLTDALARLREALYGQQKEEEAVPPEWAAVGRRRNPYAAVEKAMQAVPLEKRSATLALLLEALKDSRQEICLRALAALTWTSSAGEPALPALFDMLQNKAREWPQVAAVALKTITAIHPQSDIVPELVLAFMEGPKATREAFRADMPLLTSQVQDGASAFAANLQPLLYSPEAELRLATALSLAQLPGQKDPAVTREFIAVLQQARGSGRQLDPARSVLGALWQMGPQAREAVPALQQMMENVPELGDTALVAWKAILPEELKGYPVQTPLPPRDPVTEEVLRQLQSGNLTVPGLVAALDQPEATLIAARALAELGPAAAEALPALRQTFDSVLATNVTAGMLLAAAIERIDPTAPKLLLNGTAFLGALDAVKREVEAAGLPEWGPAAFANLPQRMSRLGLLRHEEVRALADDFGKVDPRLREVFVTKLLEADHRLASVLAAGR